MIKVLADKILAFDRGERTSTGKLIVEKTKIGFCSLEDWVAGTDYYKMAVADGSIKPVSVDTSVADKGRIAELEKELADIKAAQETAAASVITAEDLKDPVPVPKKTKQAEHKSSAK